MLRRMLGGRYVGPHFDTDDLGGAVHATVPATEAAAQDTVEDVSDAFLELAGAIKDLTPHLQKLIAEGIRLHPIEAAKEVPAAAQAEAERAGELAADTAQAAGHAVETVPALASDTLDVGGAAVHDAGATGKAAIKATGKRLQLRRRG